LENQELFDEILLCNYITIAKTNTTIMFIIPKKQRVHSLTVYKP